MTALEIQQRGLLGLIKGRGALPADPYLGQVAGSAGLAMIRGIAIWWREFQLEAQCYFTTRLLKRIGSFESLVTSYFNANSTSPFVEELSMDFLSSLYSNADPLIHAVAQFEGAFLEVRAGSDTFFEVLWDRNPDQVFLALEGRAEIPPAETEHIYRMRIGRNLPGLFECSRELL
jgi:hypothetical protein